MICIIILKNEFTKKTATEMACPSRKDDLNVKIKKTIQKDFSADIGDCSHFGVVAAYAYTDFSG